MRVALEPFEGTDVLGIKIIINKTGDGLSKAMSVVPTILAIEDEGYVVLKYRTQKIRFDEAVNKEHELEGVHRVQILEALGATFIDDDLVSKVFNEMQNRIREDEASKKNGQQALTSVEMTEDDEAFLADIDDTAAPEID